MDHLTHHILRTSTLRCPGKEALVHGEDRLTYAEVSALVAGLASELRRHGLCRGERVGIYLEPSIAQVLSIFAVSQAGGVFVPMNTLLFPDQVFHIARDCGITTLITSAAKFDTLLPILSEIPTLRFVVVSGGAFSAPVSTPLYEFETMTQQTPVIPWQDWGSAKTSPPFCTPRARPGNQKA
jgi:acyl-CoA synthetase (AMP-forming)/AMP-acid ligase II